MIQKIIKYIEDNKMIVSDDKVILGISGGADSVCLLFVLLEYRKKTNFALRAVHINHLIRGEEAYNDQEFVLNLCKENNVECDIYEINIPQLAKEKGLGLEECARIERYRIFSEYNYDKIAIAHHGDDLAETLLFNLIRGTGLKGLTSIRPVNKELIRPLLCVQRKDIEYYLKGRHINYCVDSTNQDIEYSRNRIRNIIIPEFNAINDQAVAHICDTAEFVDEAEKYLSDIVETKITDILQENKLNIIKLQQEPEIIQKRIIKKAIVQASGFEKDITLQHVQDILKLIGLQSGKRLDLPYGIYAIREYDYIVFKRVSENIINKSIGEIEYKKLIDFNKDDYPTGIYTKWFDCAKIKGEIECRYRKKGDYLHIRGGRKKLQDLFSDIKIPSEQRDTIPLICDDKEVIWVVGYRINENYKVSEDTTEIIEITFKEEKRDGD